MMYKQNILDKLDLLINSLPTLKLYVNRNENENANEMIEQIEAALLEMQYFVEKESQR